MNAPTAATMAPATDPSPVPQRRRSIVPFVVAGIVVVCGGIAVALALSGGKAAPPPAPAPAPVVATVEAPAQVTADPWAPQPSPPRSATASPTDVSPPDAAAVPADPDEVNDVPDMLEGMDIEAIASMGASYKAMMRPQCEAEVKKKHAANMPSMGWYGLVMCYCALDDVANAKRGLAHITEPSIRTATVQVCATIGTKLQ
jgi:hypothetical protein